MEDIWRGAPRPTQLCCGCFSKAFCQVYVSQARAPLLREKRKLRKPLDPRSFIVRSAHEKCRRAGPEAYQESGENAPAFSFAYGSNLLFYALDHDFPRATDSAQNDFLHRVVSAAVVGCVHPALPQTVDLMPIKEASALILQKNVEAIVRFTASEHPPEDYLTVMNTLFRPLLLDGITMMELAGKQDLADKLRSLQANLLAFLHGNRSGKLCDSLSLPDLQLAAKDYIAYILS